MAYADMLEQNERRLVLAGLGVREHPADLVPEELQVDSWPRGGGGVRPRAARSAVDVEDVPGLTPPTWWRDDEEASQSFLDAVGVRPS